jgi:predicted HTH transcriptional regulator
MTEEEKNRLDKLEQQRKKQLKRQNNYMMEKYDRIALLLPKGSRQELEKRMTEKGFKTVTEYLKDLIEKDKKTAAGTDREQKPENPEEKKLDFLSPEEIAELPF